ncbi:uncharacterized protein LACBIDRAFT_322624 [Laccaria bicolor S238N-H82]|uniref:Predicted protein n=1 Tax=Laccaria bicolor (strain S238N-H82 / ATCC MYA-4686) TaxID=486041 RepID=B0CWY9_LACBS|nr:uncharacterized protein LACBIDRAFT_322624 [Laccaria bicolor S238N-H82]EDR13591.1 predicted protein [Laccaria bicolor S238N-H82]|eukprot:XP_001876089.1 predicted protein [Laccaria bicolor S238N-H82]
MRGTQEIPTVRPPPDPIPTYEPNQPDSYYPPALNRFERIWHDRYHFLLQKGLQLRPRYRPGWVPSWLNAKGEFLLHEDSLQQPIPQVMDAKRTKDGATVCLKTVYRTPKEAEIARYFSSPELLQKPTNHSVPILDVFRDPSAPDFEYLVMPLLRPFDDPEFGLIGEAVDFVSQILEHTGANIMMDARPIYPQGWHFKAKNYTPDGITFMSPLARIEIHLRSMSLLLGTFFSGKTGVTQYNTSIQRRLADLAAGLNVIYNSLTSLCDRRSFSSIPIGLMQRPALSGAPMLGPPFPKLASSKLLSFDRRTVLALMMAISRSNQIFPHGAIKFA